MTASSPATTPPRPQQPVLSAEVQRIIDTPPTWLVRWGNVLLLGLLAGGLLAGGLLPYPNTLSGKAVVGPITRVTVPAAEARRIRPGQRVIISLYAFPSEKFGALTGQVAAAPTVDGTGQATVPVRLNKGYRSTYGQLLPVGPASAGGARVTVADETLFKQLVHF
ncbi:hypothetical protein [Hymenobacter terrestris]|uniref:HlyD family efflux transporter periplasmic adaptor subunit n=1 Tax=Hymenobacter terrestris TaxID=2748310 RepID=A0ABX2Q628_9BACT|nr:hypothetical protein [Hymenobacter terrestris]NVO85871.1 hypothetical protein [Hymenobacter terrestris]